MTVAVFARRLDAAPGTEQIERLPSLDLTLVGSDDLVLPTFALSVDYGCSYYAVVYQEIGRPGPGPAPGQAAAPGGGREGLCDARGQGRCGGGGIGALDADPDRVRRPTGWGWITSAVQQLPLLHAA